MFRYPYHLLIVSLSIATVAWLICTAVWILPHFGPLTIFFIIPLLVSLLALCVWHLVLAWMYRKTSGPSRLGRVVWIVPSIVLAIAILVPPLWESLPMNRFKARVASPVPSSVSSLRISSEGTYLFEHTAMYFELTAEDFPKILASYPYKKTRSQIGTQGLEKYAKQLLDLELTDLAPYDVFVADLTPEDMKLTTASREKVVVTNKDRTRVVFFHLYDD